MKTFYVLVVDDEKKVRECIHHWLDGRGYRVDLASHGQEAVRQVLESDSEYDIVIMDIEMPVMGGIEAIQLIHEGRPDLPIIAITGYTEYPHKIVQAGGSMLIPKPFKLKDLECEILKLVDGKE